LGLSKNGSGRFGISVASSSDGSIVAVGAPGPNNATGSVYVYKNKKLLYSIPDPHPLVNYNGGYNFGYSVALSSDGSVVVVGYPGIDGSNQNTGIVYVYKNGSLIHSIPSPDQAQYGYFGGVVVTSSDGSVVAASYLLGDVVYIFKDGVRISILINPDYGYGFGYSISMSSDGSVVAVGSPLYSIQQGAAYVFTNGSLKYSLYGFDISSKFGTSVALNSDGTTLIVGAPSPNDNSSPGYVYVYVSGNLIYTLA
jgi:hypothetical protein